MSNIVRYEEVKSKVLVLRGTQAILDSDIAELYAVETREINQAVRNNPDKFPEGYIIDISLEDWRDLKSKILTSSWGGKNKPPKAFTEKGLYMLATILKSPTATQTTIAIVETFAKLRELSNIVRQLPDIEDKDTQKTLMQKSGELLSDILEDSALEVIGDETTIEFNLALLKIKHTTKREKRNAEK